MPVYTYQAKDVAGQTLNGEITAYDEREAAAQLRALGHFPMRVERASAMRPAGRISATAVLDPTIARSVDFQTQSPTTEIGRAYPVSSAAGSVIHSDLGLPTVQPYGSWFERTIVAPIWTGVSMPALTMFYRQFAAMLNAGMTINATLETFQSQSDTPLRKICWVMRRHVEAGGKLSEAMGMFPQVFRPLHRELIAASEDTGALDQAFLRLSTYVESDYELRRMIKKETFMPKINFVASFLIPPLVVLIMSGPQAYFQVAMEPLLKEVAAALGVYIAGRYALTMAPAAVIYDTVKSYLPYFGTTVRMLSNAKFARALSALYTAGVLLPTAVKTSARVSGNAFLGSRMNKAANAMLAGAGLTEAFESAGVFPPMFLSMIRTGETTGSLDVLLDKVATFYEDESAVRLKQSVQALNILIFLLVAIKVALIVIHFWTGYGSQMTELMNS